MARRDGSPTLAQLKQSVYKGAGVGTTKALKRSHAAMVQLDFRRKSSWVRALEILQSQTADGDADFEQWLANPPDEYRGLFAEIADASAHYRQAIAHGRQASRELLQAAEALEQQARDALQDQAIQHRN